MRSARLAALLVLMAAALPARAAGQQAAADSIACWVLGFGTRAPADSGAASPVVGIASGSRVWTSRPPADVQGLWQALDMPAYWLAAGDSMDVVFTGNRVSGTALRLARQPDGRVAGVMEPLLERPGTAQLRVAGRRVACPAGLRPAPFPALFRPPADSAAPAWTAPAAPPSAP